MIKQNKYVIISIVLVFVIITLQTLFIRSIKIKYDVCNSEINNLINDKRQIKSQKSMILDSYKKCFLSSGLKLDNVQLQGNSGVIVKLKNALNGKTKIIYYFDQYSCVACVNNDLTLFNNFVELIGNENALILANFSNYKEFYQFFCRNDIKCKVFNIKGKNLGIEIKKASAIFVIDQDLIVNKFFIPHKSLNETTKEFLNNIKSCYYKY